LSSTDTTPKAIAPYCEEANTIKTVVARNNAPIWFALLMTLSIPSVTFLGFVVGHQMRLINASPLWAFGALDLGLLSLTLTRRFYSARIWLRLTGLFCIATMIAFFHNVILHTVGYCSGYVVMWYLIHFG